MKKPKVKEPTREEKFEQAVIDFNNSSKDAEALYAFSVAVWSATTFGSGLIFSQVKEIIEKNTWKKLT